MESSTTTRSKPSARPLSSARRTSRTERPSSVDQKLATGTTGIVAIAVSTSIAGDTVGTRLPSGIGDAGGVLGLALVEGPVVGRTDGSAATVATAPWPGVGGRLGWLWSASPADRTAAMNPSAPRTKIPTRARTSAREASRDRVVVSGSGRVMTVDHLPRRAAAPTSTRAAVEKAWRTRPDSNRRSPA